MFEFEVIGVDLLRAPAQRFRIGEKHVDLFHGEPRQFQFEVQTPEGLQLLAEHGVIPPRTEGQLVVRYDVCPLLDVGQAGQDDAGNLVHAEFARGHDAAVSGDDAAAFVDQDGVGPAELPDACRDLGHLLRAVRARIAGVGNQIRHFHARDVHSSSCRLLIPSPMAHRMHSGLPHLW